MVSKAFQKTYTPDVQLNKVQENIEKVIKPFLLNTLLDGQIISDISLVTGQDNIISHKLGRELQGWMVVRLDANAVVYENTDNSTPNLTLKLRTTANCNIKLYVY